MFLSSFQKMSFPRTRTSKLSLCWSVMLINFIIYVWALEDVSNPIELQVFVLKTCAELRIRLSLRLLKPSYRNHGKLQCIVTGQYLIKMHICVFLRSGLLHLRKFKQYIGCFLWIANYCIESYSVKQKHIFNKYVGGLVIH